MTSHLEGNLAGLFVCIAVFIVVLMLWRTRRPAPANGNVTLLTLGWLTVGVLALAGIVFRAVILVNGS